MEKEFVPNRGPRELIVVAAPDLPAGRELAPAQAIRGAAASPGVRMRPLFSSPLRAASRLAALDVVRERAPSPPDQAWRFLTVDAPDDRLDALSDRLRRDSSIEKVYIKPAAEAPVRRRTLSLSPARTPRITQDFTANQIYLGGAPEGIDVAAARAMPGGAGNGVEIIDLEWNWQFDHEDLPANFRMLLFGSTSGEPDHGTAVAGILGGDANAFGITGICPDAVIGSGVFPPRTATAIESAAALLKRGDILLLEIHRPGPHFGFAEDANQRGYIATEWFPDDFVAIQAAVAKGIIVVEAAGNGAEDLDDAIYDTAPADFPDTWRNPFRRGNNDSGAILVGAGAPPPGTHGDDFGPDRSRLDFSNFGSIVDAQGWGEAVTTTGYGDLQLGRPQRRYTDWFSGTSSASPIVAGAAACLQGIRLAAGLPPLDSFAMRAALRATGSPQQDGPNGPATQRIGSRPNLAQLIVRFGTA